MTGWRHARAVFESTVDGKVCRPCYESGTLPICDAPIPDPTSPCGYPYQDETGYLWACGKADSSGHAHPHVPTTCLTCGHAIEADRG